MQAKTKSITKKNQAFQKATAAQKRVMIAKDVLARLAAKKFKPTLGQFATLKFNKKNQPSMDTQVCDLETNSRSCLCCAYGALMISEIGFNDALAVHQINRSYENGAMREILQGDQGDRLANFFGEDQLRCIELAFERGGGYHSAFTETHERAKRMFKASVKPADRMVAIMENIITNNGKFVV